MKIYFVNRFFYPDLSATSQMLTDLAVSLAEHFAVTVITTRIRYTDPQANLKKHDHYKGVKIVRLNTTRMGRAHLFWRMFDYASFLFHVLVFLLAKTRKGDVVVLKTDPPLLSLMNTAAVHLRGGRVVNWIQDIFPEIAIRLGAFPSNRVFSAPVIWWRNMTLKAAEVNVVISRRMHDFLAQQGVHNTVCIPNWANDEVIQPVRHENNPLRALWGLDNAFVVGYSGNFGRVHSFGELIEAMSILKDRPDIRFLMIGEGSSLEQVRQAVKGNSLTNVSFKSYQAIDNLSNSLGAIDLHVVSLKAGMEGLLMPSKLYGALAAGRPVAYIGDVSGEIAEMVTNQHIGIAVANRDGSGLAENIRLLASDEERRDAYQHNARRLLESKLCGSRAMERWLQLLQAVEQDESYTVHQSG